MRARSEMKKRTKSNEYRFRSFFHQQESVLKELLLPHSRRRWQVHSEKPENKFCRMMEIVIY